MPIYTITIVVIVVAMVVLGTWQERLHYKIMKKHNAMHLLMPGGSGFCVINTRSPDFTPEIAAELGKVAIPMRRACFGLTVLAIMMAIADHVS